jgi:hypothetical protein
MPAIEVTLQARDELRELIETRQLPADTRGDPRCRVDWRLLSPGG